MERQDDLWDAAEYASSPSLCIRADSLYAFMLIVGSATEIPYRVGLVIRPND